MSEQKKIILYGVSVGLGLLTFILQIFVFGKPDGLLGCIICCCSVVAVVVGTIRLCLLSSTFRGFTLDLLESLTELL